jgi:hypothetical protein
MRNVLPLLGVIVALAPPVAVSGLAQQAKASRFAVPAAPPQAAALKREEDSALAQAEGAVREMQALAKTPAEKELASNDGRIVGELRRLVAQRQAARSNSSSAALNAAQQVQETQTSFNLQYLQLQNQMQNENRQYTAVSNIMKTKHDTVKNTISNIR